MSVLIRTIQRAHNVLFQTLGYGNSRTYIAESVTKSPFESNILQIIRNEMEFLADIAPPHQVLILQISHVTYTYQSELCVSVIICVSVMFVSCPCFIRDAYSLYIFLSKHSYVQMYYFFE